MLLGVPYIYSLTTAPIFKALLSFFPRCIGFLPLMIGMRRIFLPLGVEENLPKEILNLPRFLIPLMEPEKEDDIFTVY